MPPPTSTVSRKRTRSTNASENNADQEQATSTSTIESSEQMNTAPKRRRNNPPSRTNYALRNRSRAADTRYASTQISSIDNSTNTQRYNLRPRILQSQSSTTLPVRNVGQRVPSTATTQSEQTTSSVTQPRQYRLVYISDDDDTPTAPTTQSSTGIVNTTFNLVTDSENDAMIRPQAQSRRAARPTSSIGHSTRSRTFTGSTGTLTTDNTNFSTTGVAHVRLNRAIEIVIDSIQSLEGAVNNFDQLVFGLIYGRLSTRNDFENIEGMVRLSRILNLNFPSRLTQDEINALPKIKFINKSESSSILLVEKCPICLTEFNDQEIINKLHCTHLFHLECISTWLSENDSCPTCRRKVNGD